MDIRGRHAKPVPNGLTLSGRPLGAILLSSNRTSLEWLQIDSPRVPAFSVAIVSGE